MRFVLRFLALAFLVGSVAAPAAAPRVARAGSTGTDVADAPPAMPAKPETVTRAYGNRPEPIEATFAASLVVGGGHTLPGVEIGAGIPVSRELSLYLGADAGLFAMTSPFNLALAVLPQFYFKFNPSPKVQPRLGVAVGPVLTTGGGYETVEFLALLVPGIDAWVTHDVALNFLPKIGVLAGSFVFLPQFGFTMNL